MDDRDTQMLLALASVLRERCTDSHVSELCTLLAEWAASVRDNGPGVVTYHAAGELRRMIARCRDDAGVRTAAASAGA